MIEIKNLTKRYSKSEHKALDNVSFKVNQGEMQRRLCLAVFLFSNIMLVEFDCNMVSSFVMTSESKSNCFLFRILNNIIFYILLSIVFLIYLKVFKIDAQYEYRSEDISYSLLLISGVINTILFSLISIAVSNITKNDILGMLDASGYWLFWFIVYGKEGFKTWLLNPFSIILKYIYNFLLKWCNKYNIYLLHHLLLYFFKSEFKTSNFKYSVFKRNF